MPLRQGQKKSGIATMLTVNSFINESVKTDKSFPRTPWNNILFIIR